MTCEMKMYWNWDTAIPHIFFKWWTATTPIGLGLSIIVVFSLGFFYEVLINLRARYDANLMRLASAPAASQDDSKPAADGECGNCCNCPSTTNLLRPLPVSHALTRSSLFAVSNFYSLFLMMIFMTYNAYLCVALVLGAGTGHFWASVFVPETDISNRPRSCCN